MSVSTSAIFNHDYSNFSEGLIEQISHAVGSSRGLPKWVRLSKARSPEREFALIGSVFFTLPNAFSLVFGRTTLQLKYGRRWSEFLMQRAVRRKFLSACTRVARLANTKVVLMAPEGTILEDLIYRGSQFDEIKLLA